MKQPSSATNKDALRQEARRRRQQAKQAESLRAVERLRRLPAWRASRCVCLYVSTPGEVDTRGLLNELCENGEKEVAVPYCDGQWLRLCRLDSMAQLSPGRFGILEPRPDFRATGAVGARQIDLFVVPGVAFSPHGTRLGNGWGYYDRLLADAGSTAIKVGLAFDCQLLEWLPSDEHDVRMDVVVTESHTYLFEPG